MRFLLRANASLDIGTGHLMRLCAVAEELIYRGHEVSLCADFIGIDWVRRYTSRIGLTRIEIGNSALASFDTTEFVLLIDSYDKIFLENSLNNFAWEATVLFADRVTPSVEVDVCFVPSFDNVDSNYIRRSVYFGSEYIPIRKTILQRDWGFVNSPKKLFVLAGGADPFGLVPHLATLLNSISHSFSVTFVGLSNYDSNSVFNYMPFTENLDRHLNTADLVISTASTTCFEILARGIPLAVVAAVDNQVANYSQLTERGLAIGIGYRNSISNWEIDSNSLNTFLLGDYVQCQEELKLAKVVDVHGSTRIAIALESLI